MPTRESPFHRGEKELQLRLGIQEKMEQVGRRMIHHDMPEQHQEFFSQLPLFFIGAGDDADRPWASVLAGQPGFLQPIDAGMLRVQARPIYGDPLNRAFMIGADIGGLGVDLNTRHRVRVNGRIVAVDDGAFEIRVAQCFGNCPKYIQAREAVLDERIDTIGENRPVRRGDGLNKDEAAFIARSDTFFVASQSSENNDWTQGFDISHRGGPAGFVIVAHETSLLFPDYSGNCMFNTLGNILVNPRVGLLFIDFASGDTLQITGEAEILWEAHHTQRFPGAKRVVALRVEETIFIECALPISWAFNGYSPVFDDFEALRTGSPIGEQPAPMKLLSVNVSMPKQFTHEGKNVKTSIFKEPVDGRVMLRRLNLDGDGQSDLWGHGGAFRAVYVYSVENYAYWQSELGLEDFEFGQFGENFTVEGLLDEDIHVGDIFSIGDAIVEVSQPRIPCYKLAIKMNIDGFQNQFLKSGRVGFYFRVLEEGEVGAGDAIELVERDSQRMTVREVNDLLFVNKEDLEATQRALSVPALSHGWKGSFEERLNISELSAEARQGFRTFVVQQKVPESEIVTSFYLVPGDDASLPDFSPGQFLTFKLSIPGQPESVIRTYSLSDGPNGDYYRVSIKRESSPIDRPALPPGVSSNYFHDQVDVGSELTVGEPRGKFCLDRNSERAVVLLSGGIGLTPMISMTNAIVNSGTERIVWFIHGVRDGREHAMAQHMHQVSQENDNVHVHFRYSQPGPVDAEGRDYHSVGRVDFDLLKQLLPFDDYEFYLCGPPAFMKSLYCGLLSLGVSESRIHYEFFGPASVLKEEARPCGSAPARSAEAELSGEISITFARSGVSVPWDPACESILELAEQHGLSPAYSCRSGICNTCLCELTEGEVVYFEEPLERPKSGSALICCSRPKGNLVIEV